MIFRATRRALSMSFESQAKQYPPKGEPGISYYPGYLNDKAGNIVDCLLYRTADGELVGILNHFGFDLPPYEKKGNFTVLVSIHHLRKGIATQLLQEACRRWPIDFTKQQYTPAGAALANSFVKTGAAS